MAIIEKLDNIAASKAAIKAAIQEKGVSCDDTLAEYASRIKAIPTGSSIKVEELRTTTITANGSHTITPSTGFDAMKGAKIDVNVPQEISEIPLEQNIPERTVGTVISFTVNPVSGLNLLSVFGQIGDTTGADRKDYGLGATFVKEAGFAEEYVVITESGPEYKYWLAETGTDVNFTNATLTIIQEITIE